MSLARVTRVLHATLIAITLGVAASSATAQQREIPSPVPSTEVVSLLERAGLSSEEAARAVAAHEAYFERYRSFERAEVERWLTDRSAMMGMLMATGSVADVEKDVLTRRRLLAAARQLDEQLASEIGALLGDKSAAADELRDALARRRAWVVLRGFSGSDARPFSLADCPDLATLSAEARGQVEPILEVYERELTRLWERALQTSTDRPLRMAELRETRGLTPPAMPTPTVDGEAPAIDQAAFEQYWKSVQDLRREASVDADAARRKVKDLHRATLLQVEAVLDPTTARALRRWMIRENYPFLRSKGSPEPLFKEAEDLKKESKLDESTWELVEAERGAYEAEVRPVVDGLMEAHDASERGGIGGMIFTVDSGSTKDDARERFAERKQQIDARSVEHMRAILGKPADDASSQQRAVHLDGGNFGTFELSGEIEGAIGATAVMMVGDGQEMIMLSGDDLGGGGAIFGLAGGPQRRMATAMSRPDAATLGTRLGLTEAERVVFDAVFEDYEASTRAINDAFMPKPNDDADGASPHFMFGMMGEMQEKLEELRAAIETADTSFFADLAVVCPSAKESGALESAARARIRSLSTAGESRDPTTVDIAAEFTSASLSPEGRVAAKDPVHAWDLDAALQLRARAHELDALARERAVVEREMHKEITQTEADGSVSRSIAVSLEGDTAEKLMSIDKRQSEVSTRAEKFNLAALESICACMPAADAQKLRRAWQRAAYPRVYDSGSSADAVFAKALALRELSAALRAEVEVLQAEYIESVEKLASEFIHRPKPASTQSIDAPGGFDMQAMQLADRERKRLAADRDEVNQSAVRRLKELLGSELAAKVGDLPAKKQRPTMQFQMGG